MKRLITAILAFVYLGTSVGATINMHYCMGEYANWSFIANDSVSCDTCGMDKDVLNQKACCHDEQQVVKNVADPTLLSTTAFLFHSFGDVPVNFEPTVEAPYVVLMDQTGPYSNAPPDPGSIPPYLLFCNIRI